MTCIPNYRTFYIAIKVKFNIYFKSWINEILSIDSTELYIYNILYYLPIFCQLILLR